MLTEAEVLEALRDCYDPDLPCNIVDLGLVLEVSTMLDEDAPGAKIPGVLPKSIVTIGIILTTPSEAAEDHIRSQITNRLSGLEAVSRTTVTVLEQPLWSPQRITETGRRGLGLDGNPHLIQIR